VMGAPGGSTSHAREHSAEQRQQTPNGRQPQTRNVPRWSRASPVPVQMWQGWARSRCRCDSGGPGPGADVEAGVISCCAVLGWRGRSRAGRTCICAGRVMKSCRSVAACPTTRFKRPFPLIANRPSPSHAHHRVRTTAPRHARQRGSGCCMALPHLRRDWARPLPHRHRDFRGLAWRGMRMGGWGAAAQTHCHQRVRRTLDAALRGVRGGALSAARSHVACCIGVGCVLHLVSAANRRAVCSHCRASSAVRTVAAASPSVPYRG
jgi:hypothetical protein